MMNSRRRFNLSCLAAMTAMLLAAMPAGAGADDQPYAGDPYLLDTCPVSGQKLGSMGDPIVKVIDGREVRFCCAACVPKVEGDSKTYFAAMDAKMIKQQMKFYPLETCIVMESEPLVGPDAEPVSFIHANRLVRFCCAGCRKKFVKDPAAYLAALDAAVIAKQGKGYPLATCPISGEKLGSMGEPVNVVIGNRLVRLCCKGCEKGLREKPAVALGMLDKALAAAPETESAELRDVSFQGVSTSIPASWEEYPPSSGTRELNVRIADSDGKPAAELVVFYFGPDGAGPVDANIDRWAQQFQTENGGPIEPEVSMMTADGMKITLVEMRGSYKGMGQMEFQEGQASISAIVEGPAGPLYFKLAGDEDVVQAGRDAMMAMLKGLRAGGGAQ